MCRRHPSSATLETGLESSSDVEGRIPFAITKARLGRTLRGSASVTAETDLDAGSTTMSTRNGWYRVAMLRVRVQAEEARDGISGGAAGSGCGDVDRLSA
jgi:hypothetical protein